MKNGNGSGWQQCSQYESFSVNQLDGSLFRSAILHVPSFEGAIRNQHRSRLPTRHLARILYQEAGDRVDWNLLIPHIYTADRCETLVEGSSVGTADRECGLPSIHHPNQLVDQTPGETLVFVGFDCRHDCRVVLRSEIDRPHHVILVVRMPGIVEWASHGLLADLGVEVDKVGAEAIRFVYSSDDHLVGSGRSAIRAIRIIIEVDDLPVFIVSFDEDVVLGGALLEAGR